MRKTGAAAIAAGAMATLAGCMPASLRISETPVPPPQTVRYIPALSKEALLSRIAARLAPSLGPPSVQSAINTLVFDLARDHPSLRPLNAVLDCGALYVRGAADEDGQPIAPPQPAASDRIEFSISFAGHSHEVRRLMSATARLIVTVEPSAQASSPHVVSASATFIVERRFETYYAMPVTGAISFTPSVASAIVTTAQSGELRPPVERNTFSKPYVLEQPIPCASTGRLENKALDLIGAF